MEAVVMDRYGGPEVLKPRAVPDPESRPGWTLVRVEASALNWHDTLVRRGQYGSPVPHILGADGAGVVAGTGEKVVILPSLFWGDREAAPGADWEILGDRRRGTAAELVVVPDECVLPRPTGLSLEEAAALSLVGVTTYRALFTRGSLRSGESLLVLGAGGGVATAAVAQASAAGATVVVSTGSPEKGARAVGLGAVAWVDHTRDGWAAEAAAMAPGGEGFDVVLDSVGRVAESVQCLRPGGRCVVLGASVSDRIEVPLRPFYFGQYELIGTTMGSPRDMAGLLELLRRESVSPPVIDRVFPLGEAAEAHRRLESREGFGKVILDHR